MSRQVGPIVKAQDQGMIGAKYRQSEVGRAVPPVNISNRTLHTSPSATSRNGKKRSNGKAGTERSEVAPSRSQHIKLTIPKRLHEMFYRLKASELTLLINTFRILPGAEENIFALGDILESLPEEDRPSHSTLAVEHNADEESENCEPSRPYLLLDVREKEQYDEYHIHSAKHYEMRMIRQDKLGKDIYEYKNKPDCMIVVCSDGEKTAVAAANQLVQKFIDNVYVLSCSVRKYLGRYNNDAEGSNPPPPDVKKEKKGPVPSNLHKRKGDRTYSGSGSVHQGYSRTGCAQSVAAKSMVSTRSWR